MANWVYNVLTFESEEDRDKVWARSQASESEEIAENSNAKEEHERFTTRFNGEDRFGFDARREECSILFETKWAPPNDYHQWLGQQFPDMTIRIRWEEEQGFGEEATLKGDELEDRVEWSYPSFGSVYHDCWGWAIYLNEDDDPEADQDELGYILLKLPPDTDPNEIYDIDELEGDGDGPFKTIEEAKAYIKVLLKQQLETTPTVK